MHFSLRFLSVFKKNIQTLKNISYLSILQIMSLALPFIIYPYYISVVGLNLYGEVIFYQAIITYAGIIVNFGFNISGVKAISEVNGDLVAISKIFTNIYIIKIILAALSVLLVISYGLLNIEHTNIYLVITSLTLLFNELLFPQWYFQAIEKLKIATMLTFIVKMISLLLMFLLIKEADDYIYIPLLSGAGFLCVGIFSLVLAKKNGVEYTGIDFLLIKELLKESVNFFLTSAVISVKNKTDVILIGIFLNKEMVAIYDLALKIFNISLIPTAIINTAVFAKMSREKKVRGLKVLIGVSFVVSLLICLTVYMIAPYIVTIIFGANDLITELIRLLIVSLPFFAISLPLAQNGLVIFGYSRSNLIGTISTTLFYTVGIFFIFSLDVINDVKSFAFLTVSVYFYEMVYRIILCKKYKLI